MSEFEKLYLGMPILLIAITAIGYFILPRWLDRMNRRDLERRGGVDR